MKRIFAAVLLIVAASLVIGPGGCAIVMLASGSGKSFDLTGIAVVAAFSSVPIVIGVAIARAALSIWKHGK